MSFFAAPTMVKRLADDRAIAEADLAQLKTMPDVHVRWTAVQAPVILRPTKAAGPGTGEAC